MATDSKGDLNELLVTKGQLPNINARSSSTGEDTDTSGLALSADTISPARSCRKTNTTLCLNLEIY